MLHHTQHLQLVVVQLQCDHMHSSIVCQKNKLKGKTKSNTKHVNILQHYANFVFFFLYRIQKCIKENFV